MYTVQCPKDGVLPHLHVQGMYSVHKEVYYHIYMYSVRHARSFTTSSPCMYKVRVCAVTDKEISYHIAIHKICILSTRRCTTKSPCTRYIQCSQGVVLLFLHVQGIQSVHMELYYHNSQLHIQGMYRVYKEVYYHISIYEVCKVYTKWFLLDLHIQGMYSALPNIYVKGMYSVHKEVYYHMSMCRVYTVCTRKCTITSPCTRYIQCKRGSVLSHLHVQGMYNVHKDVYYHSSMCRVCTVYTRMFTTTSPCAGYV